MFKQYFSGYDYVVHTQVGTLPDGTPVCATFRKNGDNEEGELEAFAREVAQIGKGIDNSFFALSGGKGVNVVLRLNPKPPTKVPPRGYWFWFRFVAGCTLGALFGNVIGFLVSQIILK